MDKKKCPQCKNLILATAPTCLYCGRPNKFVTKDYVDKKWNKKSNNSNIIYLLISRSILLVIFVMFLKILIEKNN